MHKRLTLTQSKFYYKYFMFYLDLDEIDSLSANMKLFSRNKFNAYSFRDKDHIAFERPDVKANILEYLSRNGIKDGIGKIFLLTNTAVFGYNFNPVSFYYCFDTEGKPLCAVPEVGNTFGELKPFFIGKESMEEGIFKARIQKDFYVSPFIDHDAKFDFQLHVPGESLSIKIDDYKDEGKIFITQLTGKRIELNDSNLFKFALKYPLVTIKVITAIHYQALKLIIKKVPYFKKEEFLEKQKGMMLKWKKQ